MLSWLSRQGQGLQAINPANLSQLSGHFCQICRDKSFKFDHICKLDKIII